MSNLSGQTIKGYELKEQIGAGGFGEVYLADQPTVRREVAVKVILPEHANQPDFIRRFESEAQVVARLEHMHIVPLYDYWRDPDGAYLVMRYLRGGSLRKALAGGAMDLTRTARVLDQLGAALTLAHRREVIHRDIKPANILLDEDQNAYLTDFGIAKDLNQPSELTAAGGLLGSPDYLSPEQARSAPVSPQTDIYSLGVVLYEMLVGTHPFPDLTGIERLYKHINDPLPLVSGFGDDVNDDINEVIQTATVKDPAKRYDNVRDLMAAFRDAAKLGAAAEPTNPVELLTLREQEVLQAIIDGMTNREIADQLTIELSTVKWYVGQIYKKLNVRSRVQAIVKTRDLNLVIGDRQPASSEPTYTTGTLPDPDNPYKGLQPFTAADAQDFYGREDLVNTLVSHIDQQEAGPRFLAVIGPSGSGKSSLVKAGLVPALWRGAVNGSDAWYIIEMVPGPYPLDELEVALTRIASNSELNLHEHLTRDTRGLVRAAKLAIPDDGSSLLIVVDQFEEVFTQVEDEAQRRHFLDLLQAACVDPRSPVRILITLRADFYDRPLYYPDFGRLIQDRSQTVLPLSSEELARAIRYPAQRVGLSFEDGLVPTIIEDILYQPGALPLLQYALTELFEMREGRFLTRDAYQQIGGATGALARRAEALFQELAPDDQAVVRQLFLRLVTLGDGDEDTRKRVPKHNLMTLTETPDQMDELIDTFASHRLLALDNDPATRQPIVEVAHEALLHEWDRLRDWLNTSRVDIRLQQQVAHAAQEWRESGENTSFLLRGARLDQFSSWHKVTDLALTKEEEAFVSASSSLFEADEASLILSERALIERALDAFELSEIVSFDFWERDLHDFYLVQTATQRYHLRISQVGWQSDAAYEAQAQLLKHLNKHGIPTPQPVPLQSGGHVLVLDTPQGQRYGMLVQDVDIVISDNTSPEYARFYGEVVAKVHHALDDFDPPPGTTKFDPEISMEELVASLKPVFDDRPMDYFQNKQADYAFLLSLVQPLQHKINALPTAPPVYGMCHGNINRAQLTQHEAGWNIMGFWTCGLGWRLRDVAHYMFNQFIDFGINEQTLEMNRLFREGYESVRPLTPIEQDVLPAMIVVDLLRQMAYAVHHRAWFGSQRIHQWYFDQCLPFIHEWVEMHELLDR